MAAWADEFDVDDSDILSALHNRRKDHSQLASPPWAPAAEKPYPPRAPLISSADLHHPVISSTGFLKRFERPRADQNRNLSSQNAADISIGSQRKRKQASDIALSLSLKEPRRRDLPLDDAVGGSSIPVDGQTQGALEGGFASCNLLFAEAHCHDLSSSTVLPSLTVGRHPDRSPSHADPCSKDMISQHMLREIDQNELPDNSTAAAFVHAELDIQPLKMAATVQAGKDNLYDTSKGKANMSQQEDVSEDGHNVVLTSTRKQNFKACAPDSLRKSVTNAELMTSRTVRFLEKDLHYLIPGPAGAVQRGLAQSKSSFSGNNRMKENIPTTDRISISDDVDFQSEGWLKAKNYVQKSCISVCTISSLKNSRAENRISKLLAVIKTYVPNGCGDAMVCLKDETDSVSGIVNRRVISETEFGRMLEPGAVILLHQVAVFSPTPFSHYLNITINNVEQVFSNQSKFFKGESSKAPSRKVTETEYDEDVCNIQGSHRKWKSRMVASDAEDIDGHSKINELLDEDNDLEVLLTCSNVQMAHNVLCDHTGSLAATAMQSAENDHVLARQQGLQIRQELDGLHSASIDDAYDQLLDDTDLFA
ncbi:hypothetical protein KP509_27G052900 [Ceratopteris richardii]|uniref:Homologous recombination OB-fold protein OB-fold domain-containing protein n=1 Tax=Ceratopteris richardii TaxID=49495 RepID=A0A8T2RHV6_CERRI|nr:hypothetical protein KP509_27G052900 [Ceratopteris richardii]